METSRGSDGHIMKDLSGQGKVVLLCKKAGHRKHLKRLQGNTGRGRRTKAYVFLRSAHPRTRVLVKAGGLTEGSLKKKEGREKRGDTVAPLGGGVAIMEKIAKTEGDK